MFLVSGIALSVFFSFLLLTKRNKSFADKILALWLLSIGLYLIVFFFNTRVPQLIGAAGSVPILQGPFLFLYTAALTNQLPNKKLSVFYHFLAPLIFFIITIPFLILSSEEKLYVMANKGKGWELENTIGSFLIQISGIIYIVWSLILLKRHQKNILNQFSDIERINLKWLKYLIYSLAIIWAFVLYGDDNLILIGAVLFVFFIGYYGIKQVGIFSSNLPISNYESNQETTFSNINLQENVTPIEFSKTLEVTSENIDNQIKNENIQGEYIEDELKTKYQKSNLTEEKARFIHQQLSVVVIEGKLFKNPEISLTDLSKQLGVHPNTLSQVINSIENKNFYDFINELRVEEFKKIVVLQSSKKYTLLSLALECGFNSKTSFNRNFKKITNLSPSEYCKSVNLELDE